nr:hypothetical protein Itr_chr12CG06580 [Ipomoea trifida]
MVIVEPKRRQIEPFLIRLAGPPHSPEVTDQLQCGQGIVGPRHIDPPDQILGRHVWNHVEEEVQAWVSGGEERGRAILGEAHQRVRVGLNPLGFGR